MKYVTSLAPKARDFFLKNMSILPIEINISWVLGSLHYIQTFTLHYPPSGRWHGRLDATNIDCNAGALTTKS